MKPWKLLARAATPAAPAPSSPPRASAGAPIPPATTDAAAPIGELALWQRDRDYVIRVDGAELMSSQRHDSEEAMARAAAEAIGRKQSRVLIGGLGFGYTLRATLDRLGPGGQALVVEISADVIDWNRRLVGGLAGHPLDDPRASVQLADVGAVLAAAPDASYDAILMDVDNGPWPLVAASANGSLWRADGIAAIRRALRPGGTLVVWAAGPDPRFANRLRGGGLGVTVEEVRAHNGRGLRHILFIAEWRPHR